MEISEEQKDIVRGWVKEGCGLSEIQKRLSGEFGVTITYMEVRLLVLDLKLDIKEDDKPEPPVKADESAASMPDQSAGESMPGGVQVEVDVIMRPGALLSGTVVFSDGVTAIWMLDQSGRLGIESSQADYKPSEEDNAEFVKTLQEEIAKKGL